MATTSRLSAQNGPLLRPGALGAENRTRDRHSPGVRLVECLAVSEFPWQVEPSYEGLLSLIEEMNCGVLIRDREGCTLYANKRLLEWSGYEAKDLEGKPSNVLTPPELRETMQEENKAILAGDFRTRLSVLRRQDGRTYPVIVIPRTLKDDAGEIEATFALVVDLGEVQTAKRVGADPSDFGGTLQRIALELQGLSLSASRDGGGAIRLDHPDLRELSTREREVLVELLNGSRVSAVAKKLFISPHTVRNHLKAIFRKVGVANQGELIERIRELSDADR